MPSIDDDIDNILVILIYQLLEYLYIIIVNLIRIIYYRDCTIIVYIASFILPLTRLPSDDPEFACPGWRSEISLCQIFREIILRPSPFPIHGFLCYLFLLSYYPCFHICYDH